MYGQNSVPAGKPKDTGGKIRFRESPSHGNWYISYTISVFHAILQSSKSLFPVKRRIEMDPFSQDTFSFTGPLEPRVREGITFIGPELFAEDAEGRLLSPIASVFPRHKTIITVRGIHAIHASLMVEYLRHQSGDSSGCAAPGCFDEVCDDAVSLVLRNPYLLIRSDPANMDHIFVADEMLQAFLPKDRIQFTGIHLSTVREKLRQRGESWRMSIPPRSIREIAEYVRSSRVQVGTGLTVYYNAQTGGRFLTFEEFLRIRPLLRSDRNEALARLREILDLFGRVNSWGNRELSFFLPADKHLDFTGIERTVVLLDRPSAANRTDEIEAVFDAFAERFAKAAGSELTIDDDDHAVWRTTMFCRLFDIDEHEVEEWALGLSHEFHLNVKWLPGATVVNGELRFDSAASPKVKGILSHLWNRCEGFASINLGRVESPLTLRDISGEEREVYLVVITKKDGNEHIRLLRHMKWDVLHRIKLGAPLHQAIKATELYRDYIFDRLHAAAELGFPILSYNEITLQEDIPGLGKIQSFFFDRQYVPGIVTDKIPLAYYRRPQFIVDLARLLGAAASFTLVLGKASPRTGNVFYDDGDELIQFDETGTPERLVIIETTGSFTDWTTPLISLLPQCLQRFRSHLNRAVTVGVPRPVINQAIDNFARGLTEKIILLKGFAASASVQDMFKDRDPEPAGIRIRWRGILERLDCTDVEELRRYIASSPELGVKTREAGGLPAGPNPGRRTPCA